MEQLRKVLEDKEKEITNTKDQLCRAKEEAICEYRDSNALLAKLGNSFAEDFDDALHQVKTSYPDLDVSHVTIDVQGQTLVQSVHSESTNDLFAIDDPHGDEDLAPTESQIKPVEGGARQPDEEKIDGTPPQQYFFFFVITVRV